MGRKAVRGQVNTNWELSRNLQHDYGLFSVVKRGRMLVRLCYAVWLTKVVSSAVFVSRSQRLGHRRITRSTKLTIGPSENIENRPRLMVVLTARGIPTTSSKRPAASPSTRVQVIGLSRIPPVTTPQPINARGLGFFIENARMPIALQAKRGSKILTWGRENLLPIIQENGPMSWNICQIMIKRMQVASEIVGELAFQPIVSRLAGLLLEVFGDAEGEFVSRELTLDDMAAYIGTTREMVCRHLYRFAENGAIEISRTELRINDRELLQKQASRT